MDNVGEYTLQVMKLTGWYNNWIFSFIAPHLKGEILEVGCGIGNFTNLLISKGKVTAIDSNEGYIKNLKKTLNGKAKIGFGNIENGKFFFKDGKKFNTIICLNVLEHINNDKKAIENMYHLLSAHGILILLVPAHKLLYSKFDKVLGHFRRYELSEVDSLLRKAGLNKISLRYFNWLSAPGWFFFLKLTGIEKIPKRQVGIFNYLGKFFLWPEKYIKFPFGLSVVAIARK